MFSFEKLDVWQYARSFSGDIYRAVDCFPNSERFALSQQLTRAAVSIAANIAEGSSRSSQKEFSRYIEMAFGSLCEVIAELYVAKDRNYIETDKFNDLYNQAESLGRMLSKFRITLDNAWIKTR